ncbi:MAG: Spy/CpxP family protein refolding chaperone [Cyanobacteria bacterium P01_A01_bin.17]
MKFNQVTVLAAATILIPLGGTIAHFTAAPKAAVAQSEQSLFAQASETPTEGEGKGEKRRGWGRAKLFEQLGLSDAQKAEIQNIHQQARENGPDREEARAAREKMRELFASDASSDELRTQYQVSQSLRQELREQRFETKLKIREVLTPEQRTKLAELKPERRRHRGGKGPQSRTF